MSCAETFPGYLQVVLQYGRGIVSIDGRDNNRRLAARRGHDLIRKFINASHFAVESDSPPPVFFFFRPTTRHSRNYTSFPWNTWKLRWKKGSDFSNLGLLPFWKNFNWTLETLCIGKISDSQISKNFKFSSSDRLFAANILASIKLFAPAVPRRAASG